MINLEGKNMKEALEIILDEVYNMITDGDELFDEEIIEILKFCSDNNLQTDFNAINDYNDYIPEETETETESESEVGKNVKIIGKHETGIIKGNFYDPSDLFGLEIFGEEYKNIELSKEINKKLYATIIKTAIFYNCKYYLLRDYKNNYYVYYDDYKEMEFLIK